jgi:hypothetical protein
VKQLQNFDAVCGRLSVRPSAKREAWVTLNATRRIRARSSRFRRMQACRRLPRHPSSVCMCMHRSTRCMAAAAAALAAHPTVRQEGCYMLRHPGTACRDICTYGDDSGRRCKRPVTPYRDMHGHVLEEFPCFEGGAAEGRYPSAGDLFLPWPRVWILQTARNLACLSPQWPRNGSLLFGNVHSLPSPVEGDTEWLEVSRWRQVLHTYILVPITAAGRHCVAGNNNAHWPFAGRRQAVD